VGARPTPSTRPRLLHAAFCAALLACGGDGPSAPAPTPQSLAPSGSGQTGVVGQALAAPLAVVVTGSNGQPFAGATVTWQVASGGGSVSAASSQTGADGRATVTWTLGTTPGAQSVTAAVQGIAPATFTATAMAGPAAELVLGPATPTIDALQGTVQLTVRVEDQYGNTVGGSAAAWSSAQPAIATVNAQTGVVTGVSVGTAAITAAAGGISRAIDVVVRQVPATITVTPAAPQLATGSSVQLVAVASDANGHPIPAPALTWASANQAVATVSPTGLVTAVGVGSAGVSAGSGSVSGSTNVTVLADFAPQGNTQIGGTMTVGRVDIPSGVTVTVASDLDMTVLGAITVAGALRGDCVSIAVRGGGTATYTGEVDNSCTNEPATDPIMLIENDGELTLTGGTFTFEGDFLLRNDPTLTPPDDVDGGPRAAFAGRSRVAGSTARAAADCVSNGHNFRTGRPVRRHGTAGSPAGGSGGTFTILCSGDAEFNGGTTVSASDGGNGFDHIVTNPPSIDAVATGGPGGQGMTVIIGASGNIAFNGSTIRLTSGGNGGMARILGRDPDGNATANAGSGGSAGNFYVDAGGTIAIAPSGLTLQLGRGGHGGLASASGGRGSDANGAPARKGGDATARGGNGGNSVDGRLRGNAAVTGVSNITVTGDADGGDGGPAEAVGGIGGDGDVAFPNGGGGGTARAFAGDGGRARTRVGNTTMGRSGDGGNATVGGAEGGRGAERCNPPDVGGNGGNGGVVEATPGQGGGGDNPGVDGVIFVEDFTGSGGDGNRGSVGGMGGAKGTATFASGFNRIDGDDTFEDGNPGGLCQPQQQQLTAEIDLGLRDQIGFITAGTYALPLLDQNRQVIGSAMATVIGDEVVQSCVLGVGGPPITPTDDGGASAGSAMTCTTNEVRVVGGPNGFKIHLRDIILNNPLEYANTLALQICVVASFGPVIFERFDADGNHIVTTTTTPPANGAAGCLTLSITATTYYMVVRTAQLLHMARLLVLLSALIP
jgi:hypothetical protein